MKCIQKAMYDFLMSLKDETEFLKTWIIPMFVRMIYFVFSS